MPTTGYVAVNADGQFARISWVNTHAGQKETHTWRDDVNLATVAQQRAFRNLPGEFRLLKAKTEVILLEDA